MQTKTTRAALVVIAILIGIAGFIAFLMVGASKQSPTCLEKAEQAATICIELTQTNEEAVACKKQRQAAIKKCKNDTVLNPSDVNRDFKRLNKPTNPDPLSF